YTDVNLLADACRNGQQFLGLLGQAANPRHQEIYNVVSDSHLLNVGQVPAPRTSLYVVVHERSFLERAENLSNKKWVAGGLGGDQTGKRLDGLHIRSKHVGE